MQVGIHGKMIENHQIKLVNTVFEMLHNYGTQLYVTSKFLQYLSLPHFSKYKLKSFERKDNLEHLDVFISLGGDGTLLESVSYIGKNETPVLGFNIGRMGFLATTGSDDIEEMMNHLFKGTYRTDSRTLLTLVSSTPLFEGLNFALNDFTILKKDTASMINIHTYVNENLLNSYWADGIIIATPTGSTGYSLSCGGPLIYPGSESFVLTPINPHNLTARPIVIPNSTEVSLRVQGRSKNFLVSLDSRFDTIDESVKIKVKKSKFRAHLIQMPNKHYFQTLRQKLNWGLDIRN